MITGTVVVKTKHDISIDAFGGRTDEEVKRMIDKKELIISSDFPEYPNYRHVLVDNKGVVVAGIGDSSPDASDVEYENLTADEIIPDEDGIF